MKYDININDIKLFINKFKKKYTAEILIANNYISDIVEFIRTIAIGAVGLLIIVLAVILIAILTNLLKPYAIYIISTLVLFSISFILGVIITGKI